MPQYYIVSTTTTTSKCHNLPHILEHKDEDIETESKRERERESRENKRCECVYVCVCVSERNWESVFVLIAPCLQATLLTQVAANITEFHMIEKPAQHIHQTHTHTYTQDPMFIFSTFSSLPCWMIHGLLLWLELSSAPHTYLKTGMADAPTNE